MHAIFILKLQFQNNDWIKILFIDIGDVVKRSNFVKFPRVGRGGHSQEISEKRSGNKNMNTGLWFGPRLGRLQKRDNPFREGPWAYLLFGGNNALS